MLANSNQEVIRNLARKSVHSNRKKYSILFLTIILSTFMLFSVLTVGTTYMDLIKKQTIRLNGADYDVAILNGFTNQQKGQLQRNDKILSVGVGAYAGFVEKTDSDDTVHTSLIYYDDVFWNEQKSFAVETVTGAYPQKSNEIMVTKESLKDCGKENLTVGDSFEVTYSDNNGSHTKDFTISGIWQGFGEKKVFFVSKSFYAESGYQLSGNASLYVKFKDNFITQKAIADLENSIEKTERQIVQVNDYAENSFHMLVGMIGLVLIICFSAYLLVYNIFYLSAAGKVRYYGLVQTLGMTKKQIATLLYRQMTAISIFAIVLGIALGIGVSLVLLPYSMRLLGIKEQNIELAFHPIILLISIMVAGVTLYFSIRKPIMIATNITPMEALSYRESVSSKMQSKKTGKGKLYWRMAIDHLRKDKKKTLIVFLSLATSLTVYLCLVTIIDTQGERTVFPNYMNADMIIRNDTAMDSFRPIMDDEFMDEINQIDGIREIHILSGVQVTIPVENEFIDIWLQKYAAMNTTLDYENLIAEFKQHPQSYRAFIKGIEETEFEYMNQSLDTPVDKEDFMNGKICFIYHAGLGFSSEDLAGQKIQYQISDSDVLHETVIADIVYDGYYGASSNIAPSIIVSSEYLNSTAAQSHILSLNVKYKEEYDTQTESEVIQLIQSNHNASDFFYESKYEDMQVIKEAQDGMMEIAISIAALLLLVGVLNYVNTVSSNIQNRKRTLAIMESLGMSQKQIRQLLVREGILYAVGSLIIAGTLGLLITYMLFESMNYMDMPFCVPTRYIGVAIVLIVTVCIIVPPLSYRSITKNESVIEKIRGFE